MNSTAQKPNDVWPGAVYVTREQMAKALGRKTPRSVDDLVKQGLIPRPMPLGDRLVGWPVQVAFNACQELPERIQALRQIPRRGRPRKYL